MLKCSFTQYERHSSSNTLMLPSSQDKQRIKIYNIWGVVLAFIVSKESKMSHLRFCDVVLRYTFIVGHC